MALINCPECGQEISEQAHACVRCGFPINNNTNIISNVKSQNCDCTNEQITNVKPMSWIRISRFLFHLIGVILSIILLFIKDPGFEPYWVWMFGSLISHVVFLADVIFKLIPWRLNN